MSEDPILAELHELRKERAARFQFDVDAMVRSLQEEQSREGLPLLSFPARPVRPTGRRQPPEPEKGP